MMHDDDDSNVPNEPAAVIEHSPDEANLEGFFASKDVTIKDFYQGYLERLHNRDGYIRNVMAMAENPQQLKRELEDNSIASEMLCFLYSVYLEHQKIRPSEPSYVVAGGTTPHKLKETWRETQGRLASNFHVCGDEAFRHALDVTQEALQERKTTAEQLKARAAFVGENTDSLQKELRSVTIMDAVLQKFRNAYLQLAVLDLADKVHYN